MMSDTYKKHYSVIIVGSGQSGLSVSYYLQQEKIDHLVIEKRTVMHSWKHERWDSFTLVTPNWQCLLPGHPYDGDDPQGFMTRDEVIDYLNRFAEKVNAPVVEGVTVEKVTKNDQGIYHVSTSHGEYTADQVVIATGGYQQPLIPRMAEKIPASMVQIHSVQYKNPGQLPDGAVMVVGSGQSGAQIAEDLHLAGKKVYLVTGNAPRVARHYRGRDVVEWLERMQYYKLSVNQHPLGKDVRHNTNHYVTGRDGGHDIDLRKFATEGMTLFGHLLDYEHGEMKFAPTLAQNLARADDVYNSVNRRIDDYIRKNRIVAPEGYQYTPVWEPKQERETCHLAEEGITSIIWCIGFMSDFRWVDVPVFNGCGTPVHERGVTSVSGLYFIGLSWLHTWGSGRFAGVATDAEYLVRCISDDQSVIPTRTPEKISA
ncbi:MSMEG_0569 family flavin-dependent oxidoreductase [Vibrio mangrovi]|uniref:MSMEG_0569 family flavin-dependent oxidoreductase n=1 Tax=Vibrio mangrovi TaxID=474394 RepID=A0A1Y6IYA8_9VIBR|nr:MSMEG_0569 family flavin-dependent oxidoreductase [Vibrio mangrovi]MDW6005162.1 MSMEG_0569 family flavin-dependent oxidoreductase [Vibrio mangrovi]SMS02628.1 putative oxidoreductase CzcO [Vibrio mangrovi]